MGQEVFRLSEADRSVVDDIRSKGLHRSRVVNRAHILAGLDQGIPAAQIVAVLGVGRTAVWRTQAAYLEGGLSSALFDMARPGRPPKRFAGAAAGIEAPTSAPPDGPAAP